MEGMHIDPCRGQDAVSTAVREMEAIEEGVMVGQSLLLAMGAFGQGLGEKGAAVSALLVEAHRVRAAHMERLRSRLRALDETVHQVNATDRESSGRIMGAGGGQ